MFEEEDIDHVRRFREFVYAKEIENERFERMTSLETNKKRKPGRPPTAGVAPLKSGEQHLRIQLKSLEIESYQLSLKVLETLQFVLFLKEKVKESSYLRALEDELRQLYENLFIFYSSLSTINSEKFLEERKRVYG